MSEQMLLEDFNYMDVYDLYEGEEDGKYFLRGVFSRVNHPNKNKRIYTEEVMREALEEAKETIGKRGLVGELGHPSSVKVNIDGISHVITKLDIANDGSVLGEAEILNTFPGRQLKELMKAHVRLGVSTRGTGSVEPYRGPLGEGYVIVKPGYRIKAIDVVHNPSQDSFPEFIKEEEESKILLGGTESFRRVWEEVFG